MKRFLAVVALIGVSGCANNHTAEKQKLVAAKAKCSADFPKKIGNYLNRATCFDTAEYVYATDVGGNAYEYARMDADVRDKYAQLADEGKISEDNITALMARDIAAGYAKIRHLSEQADDERHREAAAIMLQSGAFRPQPTYQAPVPSMQLAPLQTPYSNQTRCQSYLSGGIVNTNCSQ